MENSNTFAGRALIGAGALGLVALIIWAGFSADLLTSFAAVLADPWGLVAIADLYFGFALFATIIVLVDGVRTASFAWILVLFCAGNVASALWLVLRLTKLTAAFGHVPESSARGSANLDK